MLPKPDLLRGGRTDGLPCPRQRSIGAVVRPLVALVVLLARAGSVAAQDGAAPTESNAVEALESAVVDAVARIEPSVVAVWRVHVAHPRQIEPPADPFSTFRTPPIEGPGDPDFVPTAFGAGVVVDARGLVLTHAELACEGDRHWVTTGDQQSHSARLVGVDPRSGLAVLAIEASGLQPVQFGDAAQLVRGQFVVTLGNPFSLARDGQTSASWGIIANTGRKARFADWRQRTTIHEYGALIQTDAKLNLGTSGGPVVNLRGEMVGLTTTLAAAPGFDAAAGYAIPVDSLFRRAVDTLKEGREVEYGLLGVNFTGVSSLAAAPPADSGVRVADALRGGPAHRAGIRRNDVITYVAGHPIRDSDDLILRVAQLAPGTHAKIQFVRGRQLRTADVELSKSPVQSTPVVTREQPAWRGLRVDFATAVGDYQALSRTELIDAAGCVAIRSVEPESIAWRAGLRRGMFVSHVAGRRVDRPAAFLAATADQTGPVELRLTLPDSQRPVRILPGDGGG